MINWANARNSTVLVGILLISAISMLWMFWHHPVTTSIITVLALAALMLSAALARPSDADGGSMENQSESINFQ